MRLGFPGENGVRQFVFKRYVPTLKHTYIIWKYQKFMIPLHSPSSGTFYVKNKINTTYGTAILFDL